MLIHVSLIQILYLRGKNIVSVRIYFNYPHKLSSFSAKFVEKMQRANNFILKADNNSQIYC